MSKRACGECYACCDFVAVESLAKPRCTQCPLHQEFNGQGCCAGYASRPSECEVYTCSWMDGLLPAAWRPDQCGILFETGHVDWPRRLTMLIGFELEQGAIERHRKLMRTALRAGQVAIIVPYEEHVSEGFSAVRDRSGEDARLSVGVPERRRPAGSDSGVGCGTATDGAGQRRLRPADGRGERSGKPARLREPTGMERSEAQASGRTSMRWFGDCTAEWFGSDADVDDAERFFLLCQRDGSLTMRMLDKDVTVSA